MADMCQVVAGEKKTLIDGCFQHVYCATSRSRLKRNGWLGDEDIAGDIMTIASETGVVVTPRHWSAQLCIFTLPKTKVDPYYLTTPVDTCIVTSHYPLLEQGSQFDGN